MNKEENKKELMRITVFSDNTTELILDGNRVPCSEIRFEVDEEMIPKLNIEKYIFDHKNKE